MSRPFRLISIIFCLFLSFSSFAQEKQPEELRGLWITRFEWPSTDPAECRQKIIQVFEDMEKAGFNVAYFQVRGATEVLYRSKIEPWSPLIGGKDPGFDPLEMAIEEAHKRSIELHAYINPIPLYLWKDGTLPADRNHMFYKHGPGSADPWICYNEQGKPMSAEGVEYYYLSPGIPPVQAYLRKVIMDLVRRYDIDGLHLDRIRYPGKEYSHDPVSKERFLGRGNPNMLPWEDWQREQLNKFVNDVYSEVITEKPHIVMSCAAWGIYNRHHVKGYQEFSSGFHDYFQDTWSWIDNGAMDILIPMIYWDMAEPKPNYQELLQDFIRGVGKKRFAGGQRMYGEKWNAEENLRQIPETRKHEVLGHVIFSYSWAKKKGAFQSLPKNLYKNKAKVPKLLHKKQSERGMVMGIVTDEQGKPLPDAWVSLYFEKKKPAIVFSKTWTSGDDGRFAFIGVPKGQPQLVVEYSGATTQKKTIAVKAGRTTQVMIKIPGGQLARTKPFLRILQPKNGMETTQENIHLLGKTMPGNKIFIDNQPALVYQNGSFARDNIHLQKGTNIIEVTAKDPAGNSSSQTLTLIRKEEQQTSSSENIKPTYKIIDKVFTQYIVETIAAKTGITTGLHEVRLGGPYITEVSKGTRLEVIEIEKNKLRVRLSKSLSGWIDKANVKILPFNTAIPHMFFTYAIVESDEYGDVIRIPAEQKTAFAINLSIDKLTVDFFNGHWAATWLMRKQSANLIEELTGEQVEDGRFRLKIHLKNKHHWGYWTEYQDKWLKIHINRPLKISANNPFKDMIFALEAGHGGSDTGAVGLMGTLEKTINWKAIESLQKALEAQGAKTVLLRYRDSSPTHLERVQKAVESGAHFLISIHANAASTAKGFLRVSGTSVYYKYPHCRSIARFVYKEMLGLGWKDYGLIGNFNYYPLRNTRIPAILIEQGFLTHPQDEAKMLEVDYADKQAKAIVRGLQSYLVSISE